MGRRYTAGMSGSVPEFEEWIHYCFTQGHPDFMGESGDDQEVVWARQERFGMDPITLNRYMTRLFRSPAFIADRYTDEQIARAIWFLFGVGSGYISTVLRPPVSPEMQIECVGAVATMYTD